MSTSWTAVASHALGPLKRSNVNAVNLCWLVVYHDCDSGLSTAFLWLLSLFRRGVMVGGIGQWCESVAKWMCNTLWEDTLMSRGARSNTMGCHTVMIYVLRHEYIIYWMPCRAVPIVHYLCLYLVLCMQQHWSNSAGDKFPPDFFCFF